MKKILTLFLLLSITSFAEEVRWEIDTDVYAGAGKDHKMVFEAGAEDGSTLNNAHKIYLPMQDFSVQDGSFGPASNTDYTILSPSNTVPWFEASPSVSNNSLVKQTLKVTTSEGNELYLWAGLKKSDTEVIIFSNYLRAVPKNDGIIIYSNVAINLQQLCESIEAPCTPFDRQLDDSQKHSLELALYFFTSVEDDYTVGEVLQTSAIPDGTFFKYLLTNGIDLQTDLAILDNVIKGDARLKVTYSGKKINQMKDVIGIVYDDPPPATITFGQFPQQSFADAINSGGVVGASDTGTDVPGQFFVKNLINDSEYWIGVAFVNKWGFTTPVSETKSNTPEKIETFLEARECYLVSAGFKKDHYVLDYFREFRDRFLLKSEWGKRFVQFYYSSAPKHAQVIWQNEFLSQIVRLFSYLVYFLMRYFPPIALLILAGLIIRKLWPHYR
jgi:hypothetical protein